MKKVSSHMRTALAACHATPDALFVDIARQHGVDVWDLMEIWDEHLKEERLRALPMASAPPRSTHRMVAHAYH